MDLTIQVLDLSPKVTFNDLNTFFSYCGTVEKIILQRTQNHSQFALVTFRQPYAFRTALLLNDAVIVDGRVRILPARSSTSLSISVTMQDKTKYKQKSEDCIIPVVHSLVQTLASKGCETLNKVKNEFDEKYKISDNGRVLTEQTRNAIISVERTVENVADAVVNNDRFSAGALWLSGALDKAAKCAAELGSLNKKRQDPNSRQK